MAKDAKGHGSDGRGGAGSGQPVANNTAAAAQLSSGPKSASAPVHDSMKEKIDYAHNPLGLSRSEVNADGIPNINGRSYGAPRDHAAEQRSFNSGKREINRLRKQGK